MRNWIRRDDGYMQSGDYDSGKPQVMLVVDEVLDYGMLLPDDAQQLRVLAVTHNVHLTTHKKGRYAAALALVAEIDAILAPYQPEVRIVTDDAPSQEEYQAHRAQLRSELGHQLPPPVMRSSSAKRA